MVEQAVKDVVESEDGAAGPVRKFLSRDDILNSDDRTYRDVYVERWGGYVRINALTASQRDRFEASLVRPVGNKGKTVRNVENMRARLVALTATDDQFNPIFTGPEDVRLLGNKNAAEVNALFEVAAEISGITEKDVKELEGNLDEEDGITSSSASPEI